MKTHPRDSLYLPAKTGQSLPPPSGSASAGVSETSMVELKNEDSLPGLVLCWYCIMTRKEDRTSHRLKEKNLETGRSERRSRLSRQPNPPRRSVISGRKGHK